MYRISKTLAIWLMGLGIGCAGASSSTSPSAAEAESSSRRGAFYLDGSVDGSRYSLYTEAGVPLPCPEHYCAWPSAVLHADQEYVFGAVWSRMDRSDIRIALWKAGGFLRKLDVIGSHPEVKRLIDGRWVMLTAVPPSYRTARLWTASDPEGPWTAGPIVYQTTTPADAAGFSIDYWCRDGSSWLLFMSGYPGAGQGSSMTLARADRLEGPYSFLSTLLSPGSSVLIDGLPLLEKNLSPSSVYRDNGRWTMVGTGYGTTAGGAWYERTFFLYGESAVGPWTPTTTPAFQTSGLASYENAEPAVSDETCSVGEGEHVCGGKGPGWCVTTTTSDPSRGTVLRKEHTCCLSSPAGLTPGVNPRA